MKLVISLVFLVLALVVLYHSTAFGIWVPQSPQDLLNDSQTIFVGDITQVNPLELAEHYTVESEVNGTSITRIQNYTLTLDQYHVNVEKFLKNPQNFTSISVRQPTVSIVGELGRLDTFKMGDRVLFYIPNLDGNNTYSPESFVIPQNCIGNAVLMQPRFELGNEFLMLQNNKRIDDNFTANKPIQFVWNQDTRTLDGKNFDVIVWITKTTNQGAKTVLYQVIPSDSKPCQWVATTKWEFTPEQGEYGMQLQTRENGTVSNISENKFSVKPDVHTLPPLGQLKYGISANNVQCPSGLELAIKSSDGTPVCLKPYTAQKLLARGWEISIDFLTKSNLSQNILVVNSTTHYCASHIDKQYASAGPIGANLCPFAYYTASGKIVNATGFYGIYKYPAYSGIENYVIEPGHNGTLSYDVSLDSINTDARIPEYPDGVNILNDIEFMHDAQMHDHPGVNMTSYPFGEIIREGSSASVNVTISASSDAPHGTYWVHLPPGVCLGGQVIVLTVTNCSK